MATKKTKKKTTKKTTKKTAKKARPKTKVEAAAAKPKAPAQPKKEKAKPSKQEKQKSQSKPKGAKPYQTPIFTAKTMPRKFILVDLKDQIVGRAASEIAKLLRGKHKPEFTPFADVGDFVVAINAKQIRFTGNKWQDKVYHTYSGYIGGMKTITAEKLFQKKPEAILMNAVKGMLPKNSLGRTLLTKLKVYAGNEHPHQAQKPETFAWPNRIGV